VPSNSTAAELTDLEAQNAQLQTQLDRLLGNVAGRRQQCSTNAHSTQKPDLELHDCKGDECLAALQGCWANETTLVSLKPDRTPDPDTTEPAHQQWCFDAHGHGTFTLKTDSGKTCKGNSTAQSKGPGATLTVEQQEGATCQKGGKSNGFIPEGFTCTTNPAGATVCRSTRDGQQHTLLKAKQDDI
jgi:hypothetical protein